MSHDIRDMSSRGFNLLLLHSCAVLILLHSYWANSFVWATSVVSVTFLEGRPGTYLRSAPYDMAQGRPFSNEDVSAAVAVLLGLSPPSSINQESATKLDDLLMPDPFLRPHAVLMLTLKQIKTGVKLESILAEHRELAPDSRKATLTVPENVGLTLLNTSLEGKSESTDIESQLQELSYFVGGSYENRKGLSKGMLTIPLPSGVVVTLDLSKKADWMLALELVSLFQSMKEASAALNYRSKNLWRGMLLGESAAIETFYEDLQSSISAEQASDLLGYMAVKMFNYMDTAYNGHLVGVIVGADQDILDIKTDTGSSRLRLLETSEDTLTTAVAEVLSETVIAYFTAILLVIASIIGTCCLFKMPVTRDTLLYSGAKLD